MTSIENRAKQVVAQLLGENEGITILGWDNSEGEPVDATANQDLLDQILNGTVFAPGNYIYSPGYSGGDSNEGNGIHIHSNTPLEPFDDFYGNPRKYPVIAKISRALEAAGYEGLEGFGAGRLVRKG